MEVLRGTIPTTEVIGEIEEDIAETEVAAVHQMELVAIIKEVVGEITKVVLQEELICQDKTLEVGECKDSKPRMVLIDSKE